MKSQQDNLGSWADAHVFYGMYEHNISRSNSKIVKDEFEWRKELLNNTPNGKLLTNNSFFDDLRSRDKIYLAHVTPNIRNIVEGRILYPSAGCLVGSVYCTPLSEVKGKLRMHNLGEYIFNKELPFFSKLKDINDTLNMVLFEIYLPETSKNNLIGIDYLRLGDIHFNTYKALEYLLSPEERHKLEEVCINRMRRAFNYLCMANKKYHSNINSDDNNFMEQFIQAIEYLPILGYFYFETLTEYIMLFQNNEIVNKFKALGEYYSPSYKDLVFDLCPHLTKNFGLGDFKPTIQDAIDYVRQQKIITDFDDKHFLNYLVRRLSFLTNARLFSENSKLINWEKLRWDFDTLVETCKPLLGHLIHRELRTFGRYPYFYFYFDQHKALEIWNYWNHMNIAIPFNGIIPKGEVGINPAHPSLEYKTYSTKIVHDSGHLFLEPIKELGLDVVPKLVDPKFATMRNRTSNHN